MQAGWRGQLSVRSMRITHADRRACAAITSLRLLMLTSVCALSAPVPMSGCKARQMINQEISCTAHLCGLARASLAHDDHHLILPDDVQQLISCLVDRQKLALLGDGLGLRKLTLCLHGFIGQSVRAAAARKHDACHGSACGASVLKYSSNIQCTAVALLRSLKSPCRAVDAGQGPPHSS